MCYNATVSLNTFIFGVSVAILAHYTKIIPYYVILILLSITSMQLLEFFTWTYYDNPLINKILSLIGLFIIFIQVLLLNYYYPDPKTSKILLSFMFIFILLFLIFEFRNVNFSMKKGKNKHLIWYWLDLPIIWIIIGITFYLIPVFLTKNLSIIISTIVILSISLYFYWRYKTWGTMWCYFSNFLWIFILFKIIYKYINLYLFK
jgi:hypothetical protein